MDNITVNFEQNELRSPEVQEIVSKLPSGIIRWGISVTFLVILSILFISWFVKYPDLLKATVVITTSPPPTVLVSRTNGSLVLLKSENEQLDKGELIGYLQSNVSIDAVLFLESIMADESRLSTERLVGTLGDLQPHYSNLISAITSLQYLRQNKSYQEQVRQLKNQMAIYQELSRTLAVQAALARQELEVARSKYVVDSVLFIQQVISQLDFNNARLSWLTQQRNTKATERMVLDNRVQINQLRKQIIDIEVESSEQHQKLQLTVQQGYDEMHAQINKWKETYTFVANRAGTLAYLGFLENEQFIPTNQELFSIIPLTGNLIAKAELPVRGSGKVKVGQKVNIRLENYPFEQFGLVQGVVSTISLMPGEKQYWVTIELPNRLQTSQNRNLGFKQQLQGNMEVVTEDLRLLERFVYQFRTALQLR
jgi:hypothetical protein